KPVVALVVIAGASLGAETGFLVGAVTMLVSNMIFGQGPWTPWQMFALGMTGFLAGILFYRKSSEVPMSIKEMWIRVAALAVYGGAAAVILYGGIMNLGSLIMAHSVMNRATIISYYVAGLPFDLIRGVATIIFTALLAKPFMEKIERTRKKYGKI
ncbi:MAG: ECF transporter S component, partial [Lachnospira sp.]|nr:ECF transporter S component [Lachnospira sp.]